MALMTTLQALYVCFVALLAHASESDKHVDVVNPPPDLTAPTYYYEGTADHPTAIYVEPTLMRRQQRQHAADAKSGLAESQVSSEVNTGMNERGDVDRRRRRSGPVVQELPNDADRRRRRTMSEPFSMPNTAAGGGAPGAPGDDRRRRRSQNQSPFISGENSIPQPWDMPDSLKEPKQYPTDDARKIIAETNKGVRNMKSDLAGTGTAARTRAVGAGGQVSKGPLVAASPGRAAPPGPAKRAAPIPHGGATRSFEAVKRQAQTLGNTIGVKPPVGSTGPAGYGAGANYGVVPGAAAPPGNVAPGMEPNHHKPTAQDKLKEAQGMSSETYGGNSGRMGPAHEHAPDGGNYEHEGEEVPLSDDYYHHEGEVDYYYGEGEDYYDYGGEQGHHDGHDHGQHGHGTHHGHAHGHHGKGGHIHIPHPAHQKAAKAKDANPIKKYMDQMRQQEASQGNPDQLHWLAERMRAEKQKEFE